MTATDLLKSPRLVGADPDHRARMLALSALLLVLFLSALDSTIVSTAMPTIISQLHGLERYAWVTTAYMLTSTVLVPVYGKLGDTYGHRRILTFGIATFLVGSMLCGLSGEFGRLPLIGDGMDQLIACRGLQGVGGGALATGAFAMIAQLFAPAERARYTGLFGAVFGVATIVGPLIGGFFTDFGTLSLGSFAIAGWRWIFYVNAPLALIALAVLQQDRLFTAALPTDRAWPEKIDFAGALLVVATFLPLLLALSWGGHQYAWGSPLVLGLFALALLNFVWLIQVERGRPNAIIALPLYRDPVFRRCNAALFVLNLGFLGILTFLPLFIQTALQGNATESGLIMVPLMGGMIAASIVSGRIASRNHRYKPGMIGGGILVLVGLCLLMRVDAGTTRLELSLLMVVIGAGLGPSQSLFTLAIQSAVAPSQIGAATSASQFSRQMGATIGVALFGALLTVNLTTELAHGATRITAGADGAVDIDLAQKLVIDRKLLTATIAARGEPAESVTQVAAALREAFARSITSLFLVGAAIAFVALVIMLRVPDRPLRGRAHSAEQTPLEPIH